MERLQKLNKNNINLRIIKMEYNIPEISLRSHSKIDRFQRNCKENRSIPESLEKTAKKAIPDVKFEKSYPRISPQALFEQLLADIYGCEHVDGSLHIRDRNSDSDRCTSASPILECADLDRIRRADLIMLDEEELVGLINQIRSRSQQLGLMLMKRLYTRDSLRRRRKRLCSIVTVILRRIADDSEGDMRFSVSPRGGACGWAEWLKAMRLVARLPTGIPPEFRKKLWLTLAEKHLKVKGVDWDKAEGTCFSEWTNPDDTELGVQIVKDLHRTGCSLFCGTEGRENQAVLKRVLLAYARWNKAVGYCQGFNMLAALILEVMDRSESDSLKVMIYLIEAVLPEGYFANNLRGLSVDMAVFRDLLKLRLPKLSAHLEKLQKGAAEGSCYEPPLTNVFTMQWFLTLFCNCLPRTTVLRVWDLVFLDGDEVLLTTALAIWDTLQDRILAVESADEFYSVMGELARQTLEAPPATSEALLVRAAQLGPVPELPRLRDKHRYNITPWAHSVQSAAKKGLRLFYSEDETDSSDEGDKLAITTAYGLQAAGRGRSALVAAGVFGHPDRERLALDISALKQQYARLRERQRQAHIILAAACARQPSVTSSGPGPISVNHLLLGKSAIVSARGRRLGPPQGAIPPSRTPKIPKSSTKPQTKSDTLSWKDENHKKSLSRRDSIKWKDIKQSPADEEVEDPDEEGKPVSETEINEIMQTSLRTRRKSESSSYSECSESSTSTSLCDEPNRMSDFDSEPASLSDNLATDENIKDEPNFDNLKLDNLDATVVAEDIPKVKEKNDTEFENYMQEFEELLDRTNNIETDIILSPGSNNDKIIVSPTVNVVSEDATATTDIEPNNTFVEFVDSNRGEPLRNYLDEFRKADVAVKHERPWDNIDEEQINDEFKAPDDDVISLAKSDNIKSIDDDSISYDGRDNSETQKYWENTEDVKPFVYPDYRSNSCERSVSSSISSVSPVLKSTSGVAEDSQSFLCFKSPTRLDSDVGSELSEDEKPIVLKIDKYFEHSPEFFSARKSGPYISSDEEEDSFAAKTKQILSSRLTKYADNLIVRSDKKIEIPESYDSSKYKFDQPEDICIDLNEDKIVSSPANYNSYVLNDDNTEKIGYFVPSSSIVNESSIGKSKLPTLSPETIESSFSLEPLVQPQKIECSAMEKADEPLRLSILEKTKSEELPSDQKRSFSILDEEIEAIRSQSGRRNSERALRIIQENSKILHRILINQVNKTSMSFQEEDSSEFFVEDSNQRERDRKELRLFEYRRQKPLISPRSVSLDESLQRKNKALSVFSDQFPYELELQTPLKKQEIVSPVVSENKESPIEIPTPSYEKKELIPQPVEENKTDMFGWENKGFNVNQRLSSYKSEMPSPDVSNYSDKSKSVFESDIKENRDSKHSILSPSPDGDKNSTLTAISDTVIEPTDYSVQDYTESWKIENNNSLSESYNLSSPYKFTFKSTENSSYIDGAVKCIQKFNESPLPRLSDTLSKVTECSPMETNTRLEGLRFETSQSSDMCVVSSSMSFSFDPSNDDQQSSKPTTFNSSDTLCQLTSLDQVSTPISPKATVYPLIKDSIGISQRELSLELDKFKLTSEESYTQCSLTDLESGGISSLKTPSPTSTHDKSRSLKSPEKIFNPFPLRTSTRQPKELGLRLGLYKDPLKSPSK